MFTATSNIFTSREYKFTGGFTKEQGRFTRISGGMNKELTRAYQRF